MTYGLGLYVADKYVVSLWRRWHEANLPDPFPDMMVGDLLMLIKEDNVLPVLESLTGYRKTIGRSKNEKRRDWVDYFKNELHRLVAHKIESRDHASQKAARIPHAEFRDHYVAHLVRLRALRIKKQLRPLLVKQLQTQLMRAMQLQEHCPSKLLQQFRKEADARLELMGVVEVSAKAAQSNPGEFQFQGIEHKTQVTDSSSPSCFREILLRADVLEKLVEDFAECHPEVAERHRRQLREMADEWSQLFNTETSN